MEDNQEPSVELLESIGKRSNEIIIGFFDLVKSNPFYSTEDKTIESCQLEMSALMHSVAAISASVMLSMVKGGIDIKTLLKDHLDCLQRFLQCSDSKDDINTLVETYKAHIDNDATTQP